MAGTFVGRQAELDSLRPLLLRSRLVVLTGPPGVGKTRLARELTTRLSAELRDGWAWVDLAPVADPKLVPEAVARACSIWGGSGTDPLETLVARLRRRRMLLILDNCEHLVGECGRLVGALLRGCPRLLLLATSRAALGVSAERAWPVGGLAVGAAGTSLTATAASEAVRLFSARARGAESTFRLTAETIPVVADICRRLDGIPLAIELAAARVAVLTPHEIALRLDERCSLLTRGSRMGVARHGSLQAALDWSHQLLGARERVLLRRLSVFAGGCTLDAVEAVCGLEPDGPAVVEPLTELIANSLVQADTTQRRARYRLLETIRAYGADRLRDAGEADELGARHARWCVDLAERVEPRITGADQVEWLEHLDEEEGNVNAGLDWLLTHGEADAAQRLSGALTLHWRLRGRFEEGRRRLTAALAMSGRTASRTRTRALWGAGFMELMLDNYSAAAEHLDDCLALARSASDREREARALLLLGNCRMFSDRAAAFELLEQSAEAARQVGDLWCLAHALGMSGRAHLGRGDPRAARACLERALSVARRADDLQGLRLTLLSLGDLSVTVGDAESADALLSEGVEIARRLGEPYAVATALASRGELALFAGDLTRARNDLTSALELARDAGSPVLIAGALSLLGRLARATNDRQRARRHFDEALEVAAEAGHRLLSPLLGLADLALTSGDLQLARALLDDGELLVGERKGSRFHATLLVNQGRLARAEGDCRKAADLHHAALQLSHRAGHMVGMIDALEALASLSAAAAQWEKVTRMCAVVQRLRRGHRYVVSFLEPEASAREFEAARRCLGTERFESLWTEGARMTVTEAVRYAARGRGSHARSRHGWSSLSRTELEIAGLIAEGCSNAEIAKRKFLSVRTVEGHVSRILGKLGISSRTQIAREANRQDTAGV